MLSNQISFGNVFKLMLPVDGPRLLRTRLAPRYVAKLCDVPDTEQHEEVAQLLESPRALVDARAAHVEVAVAYNSSHILRRPRPA